MSGIATKKSGADTAVQLTYPAVFQNVYANGNIPLMFEPERQVVGEMPLIGEDLQSRVHLQRKRDADAMAMAKVHSTRMMNLRALTGHAGYHLPPVVLGQRRFANPSNGAYFPYSSRQDYHDAPFNFMGEGYEGRGLEGGVLRTAQGQAYGKAKLLDRIRQLNAISAAKSAFVGALPVGVPSVGSPTTTTPQVGAVQPTLQNLTELSKVELSNLLRSVNDSLSFLPPEDIIRGVPQFPSIEKAYTDSLRSLQLIVRLCSEGANNSEQKQEIENAHQYIVSYGDGILTKIESLLDPRYNLEEKNASAFQKLQTLNDFWKKVSEYIEYMLSNEVFNLQPKDKQTASKAKLRQLQFGKYTRGVPAPYPFSEPPFDVPSDSRSGVASRYAFQSTTDSSSSGGGDRVARAYADDWDGDGGFDGRQQWRNAPAWANQSQFSSSGYSREDSEHFSLPSDFSPYARQMARRARAGFDPSMREAFGYASGDWFPTGGRPMGFFGEAPETYGEAPNLAEARDSAYQAGLLAQQTRDRIASAQARARGESGTNVATTNAGALSGLGSYKDPETGEYDVKMKAEGVRKGKGNGKVVKFSMTRKDLPTTLDGFKQLALDVEKKGGGKIRINKNSTLKNVRRNFIKRLGL